MLRSTCSRLQSPTLGSSHKPRSQQACRPVPSRQSAVKPDVLSVEETICARRALLLAMGSIATIGVLQVPTANAFSGNPLEYKKELKNRKRKVPESEYRDGPDGLKIYDIELGTGAEALVGSRVAVHYEVKWRGITFMTSRMGLGVTGGNPLGFDVGIAAGEPGSTLAGLDLGVRGMRVGGLRKLLVPPQLGYGNLTVGEIPPNSTLSVDVELLSIKTNPFRSNAPES